MKMQLSQSQKLEQRLELRLAHIIDFSNLMIVPDEVINLVVGAVSYNPDSVEETLQAKKEEASSEAEGTASKVQTIYSSLTPSKGDSEGRKGIIISPDLRALEDCLGSYQTILTPDVTYIARRNLRPELVLSDHLKGAVSLAIRLDPSVYQETSKLVSQLKRYDEWKREILRGAYVIIGDAQREYFEDFDPTRFHVFKQQDLADKLTISLGSVSRVLSNRWVEVRNIAGDPKFIYVKDLLITKDGLKKHNILPLMNELLREELEKGKAYSDEKISDKIPFKVARRTIAKYRKDSQIPNFSGRNRAYKTGKRTEPYVMNIL